MKRIAGMGVLVAALGGVGTAQEWSAGGGQGRCAVGAPPAIPGVQGPWGTSVNMAAPYYMTSGRISESAARSMMANSMPLSLVQAAGPMPGGAMQANGQCPPGGCMPGMMPPSGMIAPPGLPCGPGMNPPGAVAAVGALTGPMQQPFPTKRTSVRFVSPNGMKLAWFAPTADGKFGFTPTQREVPGRYNFVQGAIYRLKLSDIPNRPGLELYPTLEIVPSNMKTDAFLAHSSVPVSFTDEDLNQVADGNYVVKVIYLPDPHFQDVATSNQPGELVSTLLEPGVDPIVEAHRRGNILAIVRLGNIDLETPDTPAMDAPSQYQKQGMMPNPAMGHMAANPAMGGMMPNPAMGGMMPNPAMGGMMPNPAMGGMMPNPAMGMMPGGRPMMPYGMMGPQGGMMAAPNGMPMIGNSATQPGAMLPPVKQLQPVPPQMPSQVVPQPSVPTTTPGVPSAQAVPSISAEAVQYLMPANGMTTPAGHEQGVEVEQKKPSTAKRWWSRK